MTTTPTPPDFAALADECRDLARVLDEADHPRLDAIAAALRQAHEMREALGNAKCPRIACRGGLVRPPRDECEGGDCGRLGVYCEACSAPPKPWEPCSECNGTGCHPLYLVIRSDYEDTAIDSVWSTRETAGRPRSRPDGADAQGWAGGPLRLRP